MPASDVGLVATAVAEVAKVVGAWQASADRRRMQACIEAAERYIRISECEGEYKDMPTTQREKYLTHYRKRFFAFNQ
jgi:hypothetical protein